MGEKSGIHLARGLTVSLFLVGALFLVAGAEFIFHLQLQRFGIVPRTEPGLLGILFAPLLHGSPQHLFANAAPLFVLLAVLMSNSAYHPYRTLALIWVVSGLGTWLIGRGDAVHIGASSLVFGLAAFLIVAGLLMRSWLSTLVAIFVAVCYGGIFYGVLPQAGPISWEGHLSGALAGAWAARGVAR